jgi:cobalt-zinc-cadmium resistance protein CzcA
VLTSYLVRPTRRARDLALRQVHRLYVPVLRAADAPALADPRARPPALAAGLLLFGRLGAQFVPQLDEGDLLVEARRLPGTSLSESVATSLRIERALRTIPEVCTSSRAPARPSSRPTR